MSENNVIVSPDFSSVLSNHISTPKSKMNCKKNIHQSHTANIKHKSMDARTIKDAELFDQKFDKQNNIKTLHEESLSISTQDISKNYSDIANFNYLDLSNSDAVKNVLDSFHIILEKQFMTAVTNLLSYKSQKCRCPLQVHYILKQIKPMAALIISIINSTKDMFNQKDEDYDKIIEGTPILPEKQEVIEKVLSITQKIVKFLNIPVLNQKWVIMPNQPVFIHKFNDIFFFTEVLHRIDIYNFYLIIMKEIKAYGEKIISKQFKETWNYIMAIKDNFFDYNFEICFIRNYKQNCLCFKKKSNSQEKCIGHLKECPELIEVKENGINNEGDHKMNAKTESKNGLKNERLETEWKLFESKIEEYDKNHQQQLFDSSDQNDVKLNSKNLKMRTQKGSKELLKQKMQIPLTNLNNTKSKKKRKKKNLQIDKNSNNVELINFDEVNMFDSSFSPLSVLEKRTSCKIFYDSPPSTYLVALKKFELDTHEFVKRMERRWTYIAKIEKSTSKVSDEAYKVIKNHLNQLEKDYLLKASK